METRTEPAGAAYRRDATTWVSFAALFAFGVLNAMLGPVLPYLRHSEHISYVVGALHQVAFAVGGTVAGIHASRSDAPRRRTIVLGLAGAALAGLLLGYGRMLPVTLVAALLISACATAALIRIWAALSDLHHVHRAVALSEGEVAVSLAGIAMPLVVSACAASVLGWRFAFVVGGLVVIASAAAARVVELPGATRPPRPTGTGPTPWRTLATIFAVVALEFTLSFWAASYLHDDVGLATDTAVALVSTLYAANMVGRLLASRLARRLSTTLLLRLALATALAGTPVLLAAGNATVAAVGLAVTGAGIGGTFPLASTLHVAASGRTSDQALGQILTVAGIGELAGPLAAGALAQVSELRIGLCAMPALALLAALTTMRAASPSSS